jgi:hypothetical protein
MTTMAGIDPVVSARRVGDRSLGWQDDSMTIPQVWVSTTTPDINYDGYAPGQQWELVGSISSREESDFYTYIQVELGLRSASRGRPEFYLDGDPEAAWVQAQDRTPFWIAIDPWGDARAAMHGVEPTYFIARAQIGSFARRAPETQVGLTTKVVKVPIQLKRDEGQLFAKWVQSDTD